ncbi:FecCD family ABC transporter permease [Roseibium marinum]|uniref:Iron complex transport system permease protein n=1 Tax=Roseibium marinum TaxID=281252 RepID=A0A2S3UNP0_9HYPH|nr:iron ABC transporter permease [Roseibium marinum]POF29337.1 iron complex transport system permease protein [Roseibium marinum]
MTPAVPSAVRLAPVLGLLVLATIAAIGIGSSFMPPERVVSALMGQGVRMDEVIVWKLRLPRVILAVLAGAALALAGALLQRVVRNPMASPSVLGISDGAAVGILLFLWLFSDEGNNLTVSVHWQPLAAILGASIFGGLVMLLALADRGGNRSLKIILYGIALAALAKAVVTLLIILGPVYRASQALTWLTGSVGAAHWDDVLTMALGLAIAAPFLASQRLVLRQLVLDPESAATTGVPLERAQFILLATAVALTALATAHVGAIGFVGLVAPHIARVVHGQFRSFYLLSTALTGSLIVLSADLLARTIAPPLELPTGALTALVGAPLFLYLLIKGRRYHA